jgi:hypothetical protein
MSPRTRALTNAAAAASAAAGALAAAYLGLVTGACPLDLGLGRRARTLGPQVVDIAASRELVFDIIAQPYLGRATRAMAEKVQVLHRGSDMVLAAHRTPIRGPFVRRLTAVTVETVRFTRPERVDFRLVRGPVPHVVETFHLTDRDTGTRLEYHGELAADLWRLGQRWADLVARHWEHTVAASLAAVKTEAERRNSLASPPGR